VSADAGKDGGWVHEIQHDGFRIIAVRHGARVRLLTRKGVDLARRFQMVAAASRRCRSRRA
jgi:bifunctional non-homologous end joining protein LigD